MPRGRVRVHHIDEADLRRLYETDLWPSTRLAEHFGCSKPTILERLRLIGVRLRHHNDTKRGRPSPHRLPLNSNAILAAYLDAGPNVSQAEVGRQFGCTANVIRRILKEHGVQRRSISQTIGRKRNGSDNPNWRPDLTPDERAKRRDMAMQAKWRAAVYERDGFTCLRCHDDQGGNLNAHHVQCHKTNKRARWDVGNGVTLCVPCHRAFHKQYGYGGNDADQLAEFFASP